jgi:hypothetical protein
LEPQARAQRLRVGYLRKPLLARPRKLCLRALLCGLSGRIRIQT